MDQNVLVVIIIVVALIVCVWIFTRNQEYEEKEGYFPCSGCKSWGIKGCVNRDVFQKLYEDGILTENTIPQTNKAKWDQDMPEGLQYHKYAPEQGCSAPGWS